jgi:L-amino acid N-acyltransferase YncA
MSRPRLHPILGRMYAWARYRSERYVWHELELARAPAAAPPLPADVRLRAATGADLPALARIGMPLLERFTEFNSRGGELCVAEIDGEPIAALWVFRARMPLYPWLELPAGVVAIEHGVTAEGLRGRGFMPAVLAAVVERLRGEGHRSVVLKIIDTNRPSLRAAGKVGFRPVALMHRVRTAGVYRIVVEPATGFGRSLAEQLAGGEPWEPDR